MRTTTAISTSLKNTSSLIHITTKVFLFVSPLKCVVNVEELNWYELVRSIERELKIHRHVLTSSAEP